MIKFLKGFKYATQGIFSALKSEINMKIHIIIMIAVIICGFIFNISLLEWIICIMLFGMVISTELINTSIEDIVDIIMPNVDDRAKRIKDMSAGAVLMTAIVSAIIGVIIFLPKLLQLYF